MPELLQPDTLAATIADLNRRLQVLEVTARVGLNRAKFAWSTATAPATVFGVFDTGPAAATWAASDGTTGTGYPRVTLAVNKKALFFIRHEMLNVANDPTFRCYSWFTGVRHSGGWPSALPPMNGWQTHGPTTEGNPPTVFIGGRADLVPGSYTFTIEQWLIDSVPAAINVPTLDQPFLAVIPID